MPTLPASSGSGPDASWAAGRVVYNTPAADMPGKYLDVLVLPGHAERGEELVALLASTRAPMLRLHAVANVTEALAVLRRGTHDVAVLDRSTTPALSETLSELRNVDPHLPVVVVSDGGENDALEALRAGADDYVDWPSRTADLARTVRYAAARRRADERRDLAAFARLTGPGPVRVTAELYGAGPLSETRPNTFAELVHAYGALLDESLERQAMRIDDGVSPGLRDLAAALGALGAGPRDVVALHLAGLRSRSAEAGPTRTQALVDEGRLLVLQLMGHLALYYRDRIVGAGRTGAPDTSGRSARTTGNHAGGPP